MKSEREYLQIANKCLQEMAMDMGMEKLELDHQNMASLFVDNQVVLDIQVMPADGLLYLLVALCPIPSKDHVPFYKQLLNAPFAQENMGGSSFVLDQERGEVVLMFSMRIDSMNKEVLEDSLSCFLNCVDYWRGRVGPNGLNLTQKKGISDKKNGHAEIDDFNAQMA